MEGGHSSPTPVQKQRAYLISCLSLCEIQRREGEKKETGSCLEDFNWSGDLPSLANVPASAEEITTGHK